MTPGGLFSGALLTNEPREQTYVSSEAINVTLARLCHYPAVTPRYQGDWLMKTPELNQLTCPSPADGTGRRHCLAPVTSSPGLFYNDVRDVIVAETV